MNLPGKGCVAADFLHEEKQMSETDTVKIITETGIQFNLRSDYTTLIQYDDSSSYEGTWRAYNQGDTLKYATIEFAGYFNYYYLRNGKLYRNEHNMIRQALGEEIEYQD